LSYRSSRTRTTEDDKSGNFYISLSKAINAEIAENAIYVKDKAVQLKINRDYMEGSKRKTGFIRQENKILYEYRPVLLSIYKSTLEHLTSKCRLKEKDKQYLEDVDKKLQQNMLSIPPHDMIEYGFEIYRILNHYNVFKIVDGFEEEDPDVRFNR